MPCGLELFPFSLRVASPVSRYKYVVGQQSAGWLGRCNLSLSLSLCLSLALGVPGSMPKQGFNWEKYEAWRGHPMLKQSNNMRHSLPGLTWGVGAFALYVVYDQLTSRMSSTHTAEQHH